MLVYYSSILFFKNGKVFCISSVHLGNRESLQEKKAQLKGTVNVNCPSVELEHETAFQVRDVICVF